MFRCILRSSARQASRMSVAVHTDCPLMLSKYTEAAATCSAVQQHTNSPTDVFRIAVQPTVLILYLHRHTIRSFKERQMAKNALSPLHIATQHAPNVLQSDCKATDVANLSFRMG